MKKKNLIILSIILAVILTFMGVIIINKAKDKKAANKNNEFEYLNGEFNLNLIKTINASNKGNYLISPYSIEIALSMLKDGAKGNTYEEIVNVIGNRNINDVAIKDHVSVANAAFIKDKYQKLVKKDYYSILKNKYTSEILYDEFKTPKVINDWVNNKTNGMIPSILNTIEDNFALGLANALAIDVEWYSPFDCNQTTSQGFTKLDGKNMPVEMMHKTLKYDSYKYIANGNAKGVIIPYKKYDKTTGEENFNEGINLEFIAILPEDNVNDYINNLTNDELNKLFQTAREVDSDFEIKLSLPRFKYDFELTNFKDILMTLGIKDAFSLANADFTNIMDRNDEIGNLYIGTAIHKTHIDLNEKGTKAAAITYFGMYTSGIIMQKESVNLIFNKPFIYMIRDSKTNEMLFFGVVYEPNKWEGSTCTNEG